MKKKTLNNFIKNNGVGLTIGNFDGLHLGHRNLIDKLTSVCKLKGLASAVLTFNPHPVQILRPQSNFLINSYIDRTEIIKSFSVNEIYEINFDRDFSTQSPDDFFEKYIYTIPDLKFVILGHDFSFGSGKSGNSEKLKGMCEKKGIETLIHKPFIYQDEIISSSQIRKLIDAGDVNLAAEKLGRPYFISGTVVKGDGRGKKIGFPTANIAFDHILKIPLRGVYVTRVEIENMIFDSVTNIGFSPTFKDTQVVAVESHLLDFSNDIYGETIKVSFYKKLRDEKKFESVNELVNQIKLDVALSRGGVR